VGGRYKLCDSINMCHSVALRDCLGRKIVLYKYLILYFYFTKYNKNVVKFAVVVSVSLVDAVAVLGWMMIHMLLTLLHQTTVETAQSQHMSRLIVFVSNFVFS